MTRTAFLLLAVLIVSAYFNLHQARELRNLRAQLGSMSASLRKDQAELDREKQLQLKELAADLQKLQDLRSQVSAQAQATETARQKLLDAQANFRERQDPAALRESLREEKVYIEELEANLKSARQKEAQLSAQGKAGQNQQRWQQGEAESELNSEIQAQRKLVEQSTQKVNGLKGRQDFEGKRELQDARAELATRLSALKQLTDQKKALDQEWGNARSANQSGAQAQLRKLKQTETEIEQALQQERARWQGMQKELSSRERERLGEQDEIKRLDADFRAQKSKLDQMRAQLADQEKKLQPALH